MIINRDEHPEELIRAKGTVWSRSLPGSAVAGRAFCSSPYSVNICAKRASKKTGSSACRVGDAFKKAVIVKEPPSPWYTEEGVLIMSVYDFLLDRKSLDC